MKHFFTKILSFILSIVVVFSTLSFSAVTHFCGDEAVSVSYFGENNSCIDKEDTCCAKGNHKPSFTLKRNIYTEESIEKDPCCTDETVFIEGVCTQNYDNKQLLEKDFNLSIYMDIPIIYTFKSNCINSIFTYQTPLITHNFQVELQTFLI